MLSLGAVARRNPNATALIGDGDPITFANLFDKSEALASALGLDRNPDVPVAFVAKSGVPTIALFLALLERGIAALPLNPRFTAAEQRRLVELAGARWLEPSALGFRDVATVGSAATASRKPQLLIATSGSTGAPKLVRLSRPTLLAAAETSVSHLGMTSADRWLLSLNLAHIGGISILLRCLLAEASVVLGEPGMPAAALTQLIEQSGVTLASLVPTQLERLLAVTPPPQLSTLRAVLVGGAPAPLQLVRRARASGWPVLVTYGLSEAGSQVTTQPLADLRSATVLDDAGPPLPGIEVKIEQGKICIRGAPLFDGYVGEPESPFDSSGWFATEDFGLLTETGRLVPLGRCDDCIVTGGEKVSPREVENWIESQPSVRAAAVVALPDAIWGQIVAAAVVLDTAADGTGSIERIELALAEELAPSKRPRRWLKLQELPQLPNGKLDRRAVRALFFP